MDEAFKFHGGLLSVYTGVEISKDFNNNKITLGIDDSENIFTKEDKNISEEQLMTILSKFKEALRDVK